MAILAYTADPAALLKQIKTGIDKKEILTWAYDAEGDFTHDNAQWRNKAFLRPSVETGRLRLSLIMVKDTVATRAMYGVYQGRFVEMLIAHFPDVVTKIDPSVNPVPGVDALVMAA